MKNKLSKSAAVLLLALGSSTLADEAKVHLSEAQLIIEKNDAQASRPNRDLAVSLLKEMKAAALKADRDRLAKVFHRAPEMNQKNFRKDFLTGFIEIHHNGDGPVDLRNLDFSQVDQLVKDGIWGSADQVLDKDYVRRMTAYHEVDANDCFGLSIKKSETMALFYWKGGSLVILDYSNARITAFYQKYVKSAFSTIAKGDPTGSAMAYGQLMFFGPKAESAIPTLQKFLQSNDVGQRSAAAITLWKIDRKAEVSVPPLRKALENKKASKWHRVRAAQYLGIIGSQAKDALPTLKDAKNEDDKDIRNACDKAIQQIAGDGA